MPSSGNSKRDGKNRRRSRYPGSDEPDAQSMSFGTAKRHPIITAPTRHNDHAVRYVRYGILFVVTLIALVLVLLLFRVFGTSPADAKSALEAGGNRIAFVRTPMQTAGLRSLYVVNTDGTNQQQITNSVDVDGLIEWSPKGNSIILQGSIDKISTIVRVDINQDNKLAGSAQLTADMKADSAAPAWSPSGDRVAFMSKQNSTTFQIYVMNADGSNKRRLVSNNNYAGFPTWSPDGTKLVYLQGAATAGSPRELYEISVDGGTPRQITNLGAVLHSVQWSPDGKLIAFAQATGDSSNKLVVMNSDGSDLRTLDEVRRISALNFSPSDNEILYDWVTTTGTGMAVHNLTAKRNINVETDLHGNYAAEWSPDGTMITFVSTLGSGVHRIVTANTDGTDARVISDGDGDDYYPDWEPTGGPGNK